MEYDILEKHSISNYHSVAFINFDMLHNINTKDIDLIPKWLPF